MRHQPTNPSYPRQISTPTLPTTEWSPLQIRLLLRVLTLAAWCWVVIGSILVDLLPVAIATPLQFAADWIAIGSGLWMIAELSIAAISLAYWSSRLRSFSAQYLAIRLPHPLNQPQSSQASSDATDFWHAIHRLFATHYSAINAPWLATILSAHPNRPVVFGAVIAGGNPKAQQQWVAAFRQIVIGHYPHAVVECRPDPLQAAIQQAKTKPDTILAYAEFRLPYQPAYPLRTPEEAQSDLLGPLLAQIRPHASDIQYAEAQIITQPCQHWRSDGLGWRAVAKQRLQQLRRQPHETSSRGIQQIEQKLSEPAYHMLLRVVLVASSKAAAQPMLQELQSVLGQYLAHSGQQAQAFRMATPRFQRLDQPAIRLLLRSPRLVPPTPLLLLFHAWHAPAILSSSELGGIWHVPSAQFGPLADWLPYKQLAAPPEAFIHQPSLTTPTGQQSPRICFGLAEKNDGQIAAVGPSLYDLRNITHLTAGMGAGKSRFLANFCQQILAEGFTLIDGKGDDSGNLSSTIQDYLTAADQERVVLIDLTDSNWPIGINPLEGVKSSSSATIDRVTAQVQSIFARLDPEGWQNAPGMQQFLEMGTRLVIETVPKPTIAHIKQVLIDPYYREQLLQICQKHDLQTFWQVIFPSSSEQQKSSINALLRRFDKLLLSDLIRSMINQENSTFHFEAAISQKLIVLCPIPHISYGSLAATAAMLLFQCFLRAAFERPGTATSRSDYPLIVDEFQVLVEHGATQDVATAITQLRSLGIPTLYAHQALAQIGDLRDLLLINAENRILLRTQEPDASIYARQYAISGLHASDISNQEPSKHQYARFLVAGQSIGPISLTPLPWPAALSAHPTHPADIGWQQICPTYSQDSSETKQLLAAYDQRLLDLIYHQPATEQVAILFAEQLNEQEWAFMQQRWQAIAQTQRQYLIKYPNAIPNPHERIRWLSRLGYSCPRILVDIGYWRVRQPLEQRTKNIEHRT